MNHIVYLLTDNTNGKIYIGYTRQRLNKRWCKSLLIKRFGHSDFGKEILFDGLDRHSAKAQEIEIIKESQSNNPSIGYNLNEGGGGSSQHTEETKEKISKLKSGENNPMFGKSGKDNPFFGKNHTDKTKEIMRSKKLGKSHLRGNFHPSVKLTEKDVLEIRERAENGEKQKDIAKDYPISVGSVGKIVRRERWKHI